MNNKNNNNALKGRILFAKYLSVVHGRNGDSIVNSYETVLKNIKIKKGYLWIKKD